MFVLQRRDIYVQLVEASAVAMSIVILLMDDPPFNNEDFAYVLYTDLLIYSVIIQKSSVITAKFYNLN